MWQKKEEFNPLMIANLCNRWGSFMRDNGSLYYDINDEPKHNAAIFGGVI
jgi:hypothetical protein